MVATLDRALLPHVAAYASEEVVAGAHRIVLDDDSPISKPLKILHEALDSLDLVVDVLAEEKP